MLLPSFFAVILSFCLQNQFHTKTSKPFVYSNLESLP